MFIITQSMKDIFFNKMISKKNPQKLSPKATLYITDEIKSFMKLHNIESIKDFGYIMFNNLTEFPKCKYCGKEITKLLFNESRYCSRSCGSYASKEQKQQTCLERYGVPFYSSTEKYKQIMKDNYNSKSEEDKQAIVNKRTNTMIDRYGAKNPLQVKEFLDKAQQTCLERYGVKSYMSSEEGKTHIKRVMLEKYGDEDYLHSKECQRKAQQTCLEKYGSVIYIGSKEYSEQRRQDNLEKYGVEYYSQTDEWKNKIKKVSLKKYGVENYFQSNEFLEIRKKHNLEKYGVESYFQTDSFLSYRRTHNYDSFLEVLQSKHLKMLSSYEEYISFKDDLLFECIDCGYTFTNNAHAPTKMCCKNCSNKPYSKKEKELVSWIKETFNYDIIENDKSILNGKELDIFVPEKNVAIEFNGSYWHSNACVDKNYHLWKTEQCRDKNIRLIHIFEYEWDMKRDVCKSIISSALGVYERKIYARKCSIREITSKEYKDFLDINHIQGSINSSIRYGIFYKDELVSVIGFGKSRFKRDEIELHRFCSLLNTQVIGGFSKLIKHSGIRNFISYVDLAHFDGSGYTKCGFKLISRTKPSYIYFKGDEIKTRMNCQKHKLSSFLKTYNNTLTEEENMFVNGYHKIYDCGNIKVEYSL